MVEILVKTIVHKTACDKKSICKCWATEFYSAEKVNLHSSASVPGEHLVNSLPASHLDTKPRTLAEINKHHPLYKPHFMKFILLKASAEHKIVIEHLMQYYIYDFSEFIKYDVEDDGSFAAYPNLMDYWEGDNNKFPYVIKMNDRYVGFFLVKFVNSVERNYFSIAEFFVLKKYRREGIGKAIAIEVFNLHKGRWEVYQKNSNKPAQLFWRKVISAYTKEQFKERFEDEKSIQSFEN